MAVVQPNVSSRSRGAQVSHDVRVYTGKGWGAAQGRATGRGNIARPAESAPPYRFIRAETRSFGMGDNAGRGRGRPPHRVLSPTAPPAPYALPTSGLGVRASERPSPAEVENSYPVRARINPFLGSVAECFARPPAGKNSAPPVSHLAARLETTQASNLTPPCHASSVRAWPARWFASLARPARAVRKSGSTWLSGSASPSLTRRSSRVQQCGVGSTSRVWLTRSRGNRECRASSRP